MRTKDRRRIARMFSSGSQPTLRHDFPDEKPEKNAPLSPGDVLVACAFFLLLLAFKIVYAHFFRIDSDEPQHLHTVWAWTQGLLPYRDIFDNHAPLFQWLCVPLFRSLGERADILIPMRLAMIPIFTLCLFATYKIGAALFSKRTGLWAAVFAGLLPRFFFTSTEYRTDDLWAAFWLLSLAVFSGGALTRRRSFVVGLLIGATFATSLKTSLLFVMFLTGAAAALGFKWWMGEKMRWRFWCECVAVFAVGALLLPGAFVLFFWSRGALHPLYYCTITHNIVPHAKRWVTGPSRAWLFPALLPVFLLAAFALFRFPASPLVRGRRVVLFLSASFYMLGMYCFWPLLEREHYLPFCPLLCVMLAPLVTALPEKLAGRLPMLRWAQPIWRLGLPAAAAIFMLHWLLRTESPFRDQAQREFDMLAEVLLLTQPGDYVMDAKAGAIFRPRPYFYALETLTNTRINDGTIKYDLPARLIATHTTVVWIDDAKVHPEPFLGRNYLPVGTGTEHPPVRVLGRVLAPEASDPALFEIDVQVPETYTILRGEKKAEGTLDGTPFDAPRRIERGRHEFRCADASAEKLTLVLARAVRLGFHPVVKL